MRLKRRDIFVEKLGLNVMTVGVENYGLKRKTMHQLNSTKRARVTSNAIHLPGSRILHYVRFRYPIKEINKYLVDMILINSFRSGCFKEFYESVLLVVILYENVFQNPELFPTKVSLSPEQSTLVTVYYERTRNKI
jgi:hypothetical protein